jgi:hypothetical protein
MWKFPFNKIIWNLKKNPIQPPHPQKTIKYLNFHHQHPFEIYQEIKRSFLAYPTLSE